jgi:hypothetical protein
MASTPARGGNVVWTRAGANIYALSALSQKPTLEPFSVTPALQAGDDGGALAVADGTIFNDPPEGLFAYQLKSAA